MAGAGIATVERTDELLVADENIDVGDTIEFTIERRGGTNVVRVIVGDVEHRKLYKVIAGEDLYYTILPAVEVWVGNTKLDSDGVVYHEEKNSLILVKKMCLSEGICRTQGQHREYKVVSVKIMND